MAVVVNNPTAIARATSTVSDLTCPCGHVSRLALDQGADAIVCPGCREVLSVPGPSAFVVLDSAACMPGSCWGVYRRVAVAEVELDEDGEPVSPRMISERARGLIRLVETWEALNVGDVHRRGGKGRCAFSRAMAEAEALAAKLNAA